MIPTSSVQIQIVQTVPCASRDFKIDFEKNKIIGFVDGLEAIIQAFTIILSTERYAYLIYDWYYGVELERFIGKDHGFVTGDLERTITDALQQDDRFIKISDFKIYKRNKSILESQFTVETTAGKFNYISEVSV